jgi:hypothetical protein
LTAPGDARDTVRQACTVLYNELPDLSPSILRATLQQVVGANAIEWAAPTRSGLPVQAGVARFGGHRIVMLALDAPVKDDVLARTVGVSPMPDERRAELMAHGAAVRLLYVGDASEPLDQLIPLYAVAWALLAHGGLGIINERAVLGQPTEQVWGYLEQLGSRPPPLEMWVGVVTYSRDEAGEQGRYLMRTYGMEQFGLPELALYLNDRANADKTYHVLLNVALYMIEGGSSLKLEAGHRADFGGRTYLLTDPASEGPEFTAPDGVLLLMEV